MEEETLTGDLTTVGSISSENLVKCTLLHITWVESPGKPVYHQFFFVQDEDDANAQVERWLNDHKLPLEVIQSRELCPEGWPPDASGVNEDHRHKGWILRPRVELIREPL